MLPPRKPIFASFRRIMVGCHDTEGGAKRTPRLRATRSARAFDLSGRAAVIGCGHRGIEGIQPERLNAEGDSPSARSRGLSISATPGTICLQGKRLKDAKTAAVVCTDHHKKSARERYCVIQGCGLRILPALCAIFLRVALRCWWRGRSSPSPRCTALLLRR